MIDENKFEGMANHDLSKILKSGSFGVNQPFSLLPKLLAEVISYSPLTIDRFLAGIAINMDLNGSETALIDLPISSGITHYLHTSHLCTAINNLTFRGGREKRITPSICRLKAARRLAPRCAGKWLALSWP